MAWQAATFGRNQKACCRYGRSLTSEYGNGGLVPVLRYSVVWGMYVPRMISSHFPVRGSLIKKGMVYSPSHGELAFTVPLFDQFMKRAVPQFP